MEVHRDEGVGGHDHLDASGKGNDGIDAVFDLAWIFFTSATTTTLGVGVGHSYTPAPGPVITMTVSLSYQFLTIS
jgi:hypothetical protein